MKKIILCGLLFLTIHFTGYISLNGQTISNLTYGNITHGSVNVTWTTDLAADSRIRWMAPDSNYQPLIFTDSLYTAALVTSHSLVLSNLSPAKIYKYQVTSSAGANTVTDSGYFVTQAHSTGNVKVYFNHTVDTSVSDGEDANGLTDFQGLLIKMIDSAKYSIDITLWEFDGLPAVASALIAARNRGVIIRFIYTNNNGNSPLTDSLTHHGIPVLKRNFDSTHSMHNKFWIFDYRFNNLQDKMYLWTGSTNVTHQQFHSDRNNIIVIQDQALCAVYTREFEEMWGSHSNMYNKQKARFGTLKADNVPHILNVGGKRVEVYFAPSDSTAAHITDLMITNCTHSLFFCMLKFELKNIEDSLHRLFNEGMSIAGVFDSANSVSASAVFPRMKGEAVPNAWNPHADVFIDTIPGLIHHKYFVTDANAQAGHKILVTGSFNWEPDASFRNDENTLVVFDDRVNNLYFQEFYARYHESGGTTPYSTGEYQAKEQQPFSLGQNYPNPFSAQTIIPFTIGSVAGAEITIFDFTGRAITTIHIQAGERGSGQLNFDAGTLPSGIYYYRLTAGEFCSLKKMLLLK